MSATYFGGEVKETKRYQLGQLLGARTRNFLLMTATPHNGKEEDFQLFMALLDADRFEGRFREGVHTADVVRHDAPADQGGAATASTARRCSPSAAPTPSSYELSPTEADALRGGHRLRPRGDEPRRAARRGRRQAAPERRLRAADPAAPARLVAGGDPPSRSSAAASGSKRGCARKRARCSAAATPVSTRPASRASDARRSSTTSTTRRRGRGRGGRGAARRQRHRRADHRRARGRDRDAQATSRSRPRRVRRSGTDTKWRELQSILDEPLMIDAAGQPAQAHHLHRAPRHARLPRRARSAPASAAPRRWS